MSIITVCFFENGDFTVIIASLCFVLKLRLERSVPGHFQMPHHFDLPSRDYLVVVHTCVWMKSFS